MAQDRADAQTDERSETAGPASGAAVAGRCWTIGDLELDADRRTLTRAGSALRVGTRAFDLLQALAQAHPAPIPADTLLRQVWGDGRMDRNNLRVQVAGLRKRLGADLIQHAKLRGYWLGREVRHPQAAAAAPPAPAPGNLPEHQVVLTGRQPLLARLESWLREPGARVTLTGVPGIGKTALALAAAQRLRRHPAEGVWLVDLSALPPGGDVCATVAGVLGLPASAAAGPQRLAQALRGRPMLLLIDNCEHVHASAQALCDALLRDAREVSVLATSRRALKCAGEQLLTLEPLSAPDEDTLAAARASHAVALFEARARQADARFALNAGNAAALCRIARLLGGVPLAIQFAAARVSLWGVAALSQQLGDADGPAARRCAAPGRFSARRRRPSAGVTRCWARPHRRCWRCWGAFAGSVPLGALQRLAAEAGIAREAVLVALADLLDNSLLSADVATLVGENADPRRPASSEPRYTMHALVRDFAHQLLQARDDAAVLHRAHALWCRTLIDDTAPGEIRRPRAAMPPPHDFDNLRKAIRWASAHDLPLAMDLCARLGPFWRARGLYREALDAMLPLLDQALPAGQALLRVRLRNRLCGLLFETAQHDRLLSQAQAAADEALALGNDPEAAHGMIWVGLAHNLLGAGDAAAAALEQSLHLARGAGDVVHEGHSLANLALMRIAQRRFAEAQADLQRAIEIGRRIDDPFIAAVGHENLGELALSEGRFGDALSHGRAAIAAYRRLQMTYRMANVGLLVVLSQHGLGAWEPACASLQEVLHSATRHGFERLIGESLACLAGLHLAQGQPQRARALLRAADQLLEAAGARLLGYMAEAAARWRQAVAATDLPAPAAPSVSVALQWAAELGLALARTAAAGPPPDKGGADGD